MKRQEAFRFMDKDLFGRIKDLTQVGTFHIMRTIKSNQSFVCILYYLKTHISMTTYFFY